MRKVLFVTHELLGGLPASLLDRRGVRTRTVDDEESALRTCAAWRPDVVVLPAAMAGVAAELKASTPSCGVLIVGDVEDGPAIDARAPADSVSAVLAELGAILGVRLRASPRLDVDLMARVNPGGDQDPILAHVVELSDSGLLLECETELTQGMELGIEFHLPDRPDPVSPRGIVVSGDAAKQRYGVAFSKTSAGDRDAIVVFVELQIAARNEMTQSSQDAD